MHAVGPTGCGDRYHLVPVSSCVTWVNKMEEGRSAKNIGGVPEGQTPHLSQIETALLRVAGFGVTFVLAALGALTSGWRTRVRFVRCGRGLLLPCIISYIPPTSLQVKTRL